MFPAGDCIYLSTKLLPMDLFTRLSHGWALSLQSFKVLRHNRQLILFPLLSGLSITVVLLFFVMGTIAAAGWDPDIIAFQGHFTGYIFAFLFYLINYFVVVFFNAALMYCSGQYFKGEQVSVKAGLHFAAGRIKPIFSWALFAATVGTLLRIIQDNVGFVGKIITAITGIVWSAATFFVVPVIAYEGLGPVDACKRSARLMREKWGESLGAGFSFFLIQLVLVLVIGGGFFVVGLLLHPLAGIILGCLALLLTIAVISATRAIFISAVYYDVIGDPVKHFNEKFADRLFESK